MKNFKLINNLTIITPFKGKNNLKLYQTIDFLYKQNIKLTIRHLIIYDISSPNIKDIENLFINKRNYYLKFISTNQKGIYNSINQGLRLLKKDDYYMIIGAGDFIFLENTSNIKIKNLLFCEYKLSNRKTKFNKCRNLYSGMPYCHNAIIFKFNLLLYNNRYSISGDYDYFLKYIKKENININDKNNYNDEINIIFEAENGISSKSLVKKNFQNLYILFENFGFKYIVFYIMLNIKKCINRIYE